MYVPNRNNPPGVVRVRESIWKLAIPPNQSVNALGSLGVAQLTKAGIQVHARDALVREARSKDFKWNSGDDLKLKLQVANMLTQAIHPTISGDDELMPLSPNSPPTANTTTPSSRIPPPFISPLKLSKGPNDTGHQRSHRIRARTLQRLEAQAARRQSRSLDSDTPTEESSELNEPIANEPTSGVELNRFLHLSNKYGVKRATEIINNYGYDNTTTEAITDRSMHEYAPLRIARAIEHFPPDAFNINRNPTMNRWGLPIGSRLLQRLK